MKIAAIYRLIGTYYFSNHGTRQEGVHASLLHTASSIRPTRR
ncbi:hypothetical protein [Planococcus sp. MB-3u-03]|nr:hypothetical protein [Planococcus sp. MB-3u-03]